MYDGPKRERHEVCRIYDGWSIQRVDGKSVKPPIKGTPGLFVIDVLPGEHVLTVEYGKYYGNQSTPGLISTYPIELKFNAERGHDYELFDHTYNERMFPTGSNVGISEANYYVGILDKKTRSIVAISYK
jgi:hypothetical protein